MHTEGSGENSPTRDINRVQMALVAQLFQTVGTMHHIDELLQWLAYAIVQHFNIQLAQFWTNQISQTDRLVLLLRAIVRQDITLPEQVVINNHVALVAQRVISERRSYQLQSVETIFPSFQATLLKRYGLNYCGACFTSANFLLPPSETMFTEERSSTPLAMTTLLLCRQLPPPDLAAAIGVFLDQAVAIAGNRGLLLPMGGSIRPQAASQVTPQPLLNTPRPLLNTPRPLPLETPHTLEQLIPARRQDADLLLSDNPFASATVISDKQVRRLHTAIDGRTDIASLCGITGMSLKEVYIALQKLLEQHRIELYKPNGQLVKVPPLLKEF